MHNETAAQLVRHLSHPNGWWRDTAQQLLVLKQDKSVVPALQTIVRTSPNLLARFHALWTLEGLGALSATLVRQQMEDPEPRMRIQAIRASETLYKAGERSLADDYRGVDQGSERRRRDSGDADAESLEGSRCRGHDQDDHGEQPGPGRAGRRIDGPESAGRPRRRRPRRSAHLRRTGAQSIAAQRSTTSCASPAMGRTASARRNPSSPRRWRRRWRVRRA